MFCGTDNIMWIIPHVQTMKNILQDIVTLTKHCYEYE